MRRQHRDMEKKLQEAMQGNYYSFIYYLPMIDYSTKYGSLSEHLFSGIGFNEQMGK